MSDRISESGKIRAALTCRRPSPFSVPRRLSLALSLVVLVAAHATELPAELSAALQEFRADGPKGWGFTQTTAAGAESLVEQFDPSEPDFSRWTLVRKDGRDPTASESQTYREGKTRRSSATNAPRLQDQLDLSSAKLERTDGERSIWSFHLAAGGTDDRTAGFMTVTVTFHRPTRTIERVEIASIAPFSPMLGVKIAETNTRMDYSLPDSDHPSLLQRVTLRVGEVRKKRGG